MPVENDESGEPSKSHKKRAVFTLSKKILATESGAEFRSLLIRIADDGVVTKSEFEELSTWLKAHFSSEIPAVRFLTEEIATASRRPNASADDLRYLLECVLRVLPKADRDKIVPKSNEPAWVNDPITDAQVRYITALGGNPEECSTKGAASALIDALLADGRTAVTPATSRQRMLLRFWDKEEVAEKGKDLVSEWIDEWHAEDPRREEAWRRWKNENEDDGEQGAPENVPVGAGFDYLPENINPLPSQEPAGNGCASCLVYCLVSAIAMAGAILLLSSCLKSRH